MTTDKSNTKVTKPYADRPPRSHRGVVSTIDSTPVFIAGDQVVIRTTNQPCTVLEMVTYDLYRLSGIDGQFGAAELQMAPD